jgi:pyrimidine operon attenuation protein/uracil phosphoribosyltransferase
VGRFIETRRSEMINVGLRENDGEDKVLIEERQD